MTKETLETTNKLIIPTAGKDTKSQEIFDSLESISDKEIMKAGEEMEKVKMIEGKKKLKGDTEAILKDLKENHVTIEENAEIMGYKGKKVHINLPAVGNFEGLKFNYFISDENVSKKDFKQKPELKKESYSMSDISKLFHAMNKYMIELKGNNDGDMDYENELKYWENYTSRCNAGDCLKAITGLDDHYWLVDKYLQKIINPHVRLACRDDNCCFDRYEGDVVSRLLLRLS